MLITWHSFDPWLKAVKHQQNKKSQLKGRLILQTVHENGQEKQVLPPPEVNFSRHFYSLHFHKNLRISYVFRGKIHFIHE